MNDNHTRNLEALAREVLDDELAWGALDPGHHPEGQVAVYRMAYHAPALARAVIAVAELHEPDHTYPDCPKCIHCSEMASAGTRRIAVLWPCDTVTAMFDAMKDNA